MKNKSTVFKNASKSRLSLWIHFIAAFVFLSLILRLGFLFWQHSEVSWNPISILRTLLTGAFYDLGVCVFITIPSLLYMLVWPNKFVGSLADKVLTYFFFSLTVFVLMFTFLAEVTFWEEFHSRFNFIAVDYLIYTHEVVSNIQQSYPLPLLIGIVAAATVGEIWLFIKWGVFKNTFTHKITFPVSSTVFVGALATAAVFIAFVRNNDAEWSDNRYNNEISKAGIYSFFAEFRNNRMDYADFYTTIDNKTAFKMVRAAVKEDGESFISEGTSVKRTVTGNPDAAKPNVVFILMESMSGSFMKEFGNDKNITPTMDALAQNSVFFSNLYATGTRTVRGMEAVTLCIPPTPGQSIVKRPDNHGLYTINSVFKEKGYQSSFFYGGDGYFDNMNSYYGGNGFTIYDRGHGSILADDIKVTRNHIEDSEVTFENAWGICDEDIYKKMLSVADEKYKIGEPFFNFVMTTSNHRPYTYPSGRIDIPSGSGRDGAVKYADYALGKMIKEAKAKPWFKNTVFVIVADHCASSAGKDEIDVANYHIPAYIYNAQGVAPQKTQNLCSQIDLMPTLFGLLNWDYTSGFFGQNVLKGSFKQRALLGTYRKLTLMKGNDVMILGDQKKQNFYSYNKTDNSLKAKKIENAFLDEAISWYQTADYLFANKLLKE